MKPHIKLFSVIRKVPNKVSVGFQNMEQSFVSSDSRAVETMFIHPLYNNETFDHAFGLMKLTNASTLDIVTLNADPSIPTLYEELTVLGTGSGRTNGNQLHQVDVRALDPLTCERTRNSAGFPIVVSNASLCAGNGTNGFCDEDWGGPLILPRNKNSTRPRAVQVGVISWLVL